MAAVSEASDSNSEVGAGEKVLGEITFDIVVPDEGVTHVEGCYRHKNGNWQVYYLTNRHDKKLLVDAPLIKTKAVFASGIDGVSGVVPSRWILNKKNIMEIFSRGGRR